MYYEFVHCIIYVCITSVCICVCVVLHEPGVVLKGWGREGRV